MGGEASDPVLRVRGLQKRYAKHGRPALGGVDLELYPGTAFGLIGPNGAGKTTFIKSILGIVQPSAGNIALFGMQPSDPKARRRVGYLPERLSLPESWTAAQFLFSVARHKRVRLSKKEAQQSLQGVGLGGEERAVGKFSKGMKQRLGLAGALLGNPELLVLDEPTDGIDPLGRREIRGILEATRTRGTALILNSHLLSETERICDRIGILHEGHLVRQGALETLAAAEGRYRATFASADAALLQDAGWLSISESPDTYIAEAPDAEALDAKLMAARATGALLVSLTQDQRSLEDILQEALQATP